MRINFSDTLSDTLPAFEEIRTFVSAGAVMNIFLLDPIRGLLASFVWLRSTNTIGLYIMPDWEEDAYVFVDTGLQCVSTPLQRPHRLYTHRSIGLIWHLVLYSR